MLEDPYTALAGGAISAPAQETIVGQLQSPANGAPKTPRPRHGIKDTAKPGGPIHPGRTFPGFQDKVDRQFRDPRRRPGTQCLDECRRRGHGLSFVRWKDGALPWPEGTEDSCSSASALGHGVVRGLPLELRHSK